MGPHAPVRRCDVLFAAPFDVERLAVTGPETPVIEDVARVDYAFSWPTWTRDGQSVAHRSLRDGKSSIYRMSVEFDVTPDPQRFLVMGLPEADTGGANSFTVITNWFEDLLRHAPVKR